MSLNICPNGRVFLGPTYANGTLNFYDVGTSTPQTVYQDKNGATPHTQPISLDAYGSAIVFLTKDAKMVAKTPDAVTMFTQDGGLTPVTTSETGDNRVTNGSAEIDTDGDGIPDNWSVTGETDSTNQRVSSDQVHGAYCFKSTDGGSGGGTWLHNNYIEVSENEEIGYDYELNSSHANVRNVIDLLWYDKDKNQLAGGSAKTTILDDSATNPVVWTKYFGAVTPPATAVYCRPQIYLCHSSAASAGKWAEFDNIRLGNPTAAHFLTISGDLLYADSANSPARLAIGSEGLLLKSVGGAPKYALPDGYLFGLTLSNDAGDTSHDINVTAGIACSADNDTGLVLSAETTKQIDATWSAGDDAGGLSSSLTAPANDTWYHVFLVEIAGAVDVLFDTSETCANGIADHSVTKYRLIDSVLTDGSANIIQFKMSEGLDGARKVAWDVAVVDASGTNPGTSANTLALSVPTGRRVKANISVGGDSNDGALPNVRMIVTQTDQTDTAPTNTLNDMRLTRDYPGGSVIREVLTDTSAQIRHRWGGTVTNLAYNVTTIGWQS